MIILHFDLQPQFKYMNYFIYTSHQCFHYSPCLTTMAIIKTNSMPYRTRRNILESYVMTQPQKIQKGRSTSLLLDNEPSRIKLKYWNSLKQSYDGSGFISVSRNKCQFCLRRGNVMLSFYAELMLNILRKE